jgi:hypothetical protein
MVFSSIGGLQPILVGDIVSYYNPPFGAFFNINLNMLRKSRSGFIPARWRLRWLFGALQMKKNPLNGHKNLQVLYLI